MYELAFYFIIHDTGTLLFFTKDIFKQLPVCGLHRDAALVIEVIKNPTVGEMQVKQSKSPQCVNAKKR